MHFSDINECEENTDNCDCQATCSNFPGGFSCECNPGYEGDGVTCTGEGTQQLLQLYEKGRKTI